MSVHESQLADRIAELEAELARAKQEILRLRHRINEGMSIIVNVGQTITSATDLTLAFRMAVAYMAEFFYVDLAGIFTLDADRYKLEVYYGVERPFVIEFDLASVSSTGSVLAQAICDRSPVQISDKAQETVDPNWTFVQQEGIHTLLIVPALRGDNVIGGVVFCRRQPSAFDRDQVAFLQSLVQLYVHLSENVRLLRSEREQRRLAEAMYRLGIVLGATLDSDAVLDHLLEQMGSVIPYDAACVMLIEGDAVRISRTRGYERFGISLEQLSHLEFQLSGVANLRQIFESKEPVVIADTWADPLWVRLPGLDYIRSWIGVPILVDRQVVGILSLDSIEPGFYHSEHLRLLDAFATQAALALRNARLFEAEARRRREAETLWTAAQALSKTLDLHRVFDLILHELQRVVPYDSASVHQIEGNWSQIIGGRGFPNPEQIIGLKFDLTQTDNPNHDVALKKEPVILADVYNYYAEFRREPHTPAQIRSWLGVPLLVGDRLIGMLALDKREVGFYTQEHARLAMAFAAQAAIAIENARLYAQAQREIQERMRVEASLRQSQEALRASEAQYRSTLDAMRDVIHVVDADFRLVLANQALIQWLNRLGLSPQAIGKNLFELFPFLPQRVRDEYEQVLATGEPLFTEEFIEVEGERYYTETIKIPICDEKRVGRIVTVIRDVTERKRLEVQFQQAQKMEILGRLAGGVAHDFNNMLTAIIGYNELLLEGLQEGDPNYEELVEIRRVSEHAAELTSQLLVFSRKKGVEAQVIAINDIVANIERMLSRLIGEDIDVTVVLDPQAGYIRADAGQLEQVLFNLAVNARDAMPQGGRLIIQTEHTVLDHTLIARYASIPAGTYSLILVGDTGIGMSEAILSRLFEPFFTTKEPGKGTGLGLATVYWVVQQYGGYIDVKSRPGEGTIFYLYFPNVQVTEQNGFLHLPEKALAPGTETILLVEDEEMVRNLAERILLRSGYRVLTAGDGYQAIDIVLKFSEKIDLLLTDVVMPRMSGRELAERVQALRPGIKVLYMSGHTDDAILYHGIERSEIAFLQKPFSLHSLTSQVRKVLSG